MKVPRRPPDFLDLLSRIASPEKLDLICREGKKTEDEGKYRHWDTVRHLEPPKGLTLEEWWCGIKLTRSLGYKTIPLKDGEKKESFFYNLPDPCLKFLYEIDLSRGGGIELPQEILNAQTKERYILHSLMQEAITSSQVEGAVTTRKVAKEMLRSGRAPRDRSEQMIKNNFNAMEKVQTWKKSPLTKDLIFEIHQVIVERALDNPEAAGRFRSSDEKVVVEDFASGEILHTPPSAEELPKRLEMMCSFANDEILSHFIHPVIRAIILHFWLAYDHPFVDGNGRTARALFYWFMLREGYWLFEFISISEIILKAPVQYGKAFLYTETDQNDLTYFILNQLEVIQRALDSLKAYVQQKRFQLKEVEELVEKDEEFNSRQEAILAHAFRNPYAEYTIEGHKKSHQIAYDTARNDLLKLVDKKLLNQVKKGKAYVFRPSNNLIDRIRDKK